MKNFFYITLSAFILASTSAHASDGRFGLGFILGDPTAISAKWYTTSERAYDLQVSFVHDDFFLVYGDSLFHFPAMLGNGKFAQRIAPYFGFGAFGVFASNNDHPKGNYFDKRDNKAAIGVRIPFGMEWIWDKAPLGVGVEVTPGVVVAPATIGFLQGGITLRYYF